MKPEHHKRYTNILILLGLYVLFGLALIITSYPWNVAFVYNRPHGATSLVLLSIVPTIIAGLAVGHLVPVFVDAETPLLWAVALGFLAAVGDITNYGAIRYFGRPLWEGVLQAVLIIASVVVGCATHIWRKPSRPAV